MITPLVKEADWLGALKTLPSWVPSAKPILIVAPHPDDESLGAGGFIASQRARGIEITVAAVTDGENAYTDARGLRELRRHEQTKALARLGVARENIVRFELPDSDVESREPELTTRLADLISQNTHLIAPWKGDFHPDHQACGRAAEDAARRTGATLTSYFFWTWHRGCVDLLKELPLRRFALDDELLRAKSEALLCHRSQLSWKGGDPILPEELLAPARRPFEVFSVS
jgi:LmbE family N-acetylglucosaminyl deacetylase